jgi:predicted site-specific integrase-resolvase
MATATKSEKTYRPEALANALGISGKIVRAYLRQTFPRPAEAKGTTWVLSEAQAKQTLEHFKKRNPDATS